MRLIIAGSRTLDLGVGMIEAFCDQFKLYNLDSIVCGEAKGIDTSGKKFAEEFSIPVDSFPADWDKLGRAAGHIRNAEMAKHGDILLLIWDGRSHGSHNMKENMQRLKKPVCEVIINITYNDSRGPKPKPKSDFSFADFGPEPSFNTDDIPF